MTKSKLNLLAIAITGAVAVVFVFIGFAYLVAHHRKQGAADSNTASKSIINEITAETIVTSKPGGFACLSHDSAIEMVYRLSNSEKTKVQGLLDSMQCFGLPAAYRYRVLHVERSSAIAEITNEKNTEPDGMWSPIDALVLVN